MTYFPDQFLLEYDATTTETLSGREINGVATYIKVVKQTSSLSTGSNAIAHGISVLDQILRANIMCVRPISGVPEWVPVPFHTTSTSFATASDFDATNMNIILGTGWTGTNNILTSVIAILEYTKV